MDPNAVLAEIRALSSRIDQFQHDRSYCADAAVRLAELIEALDEWLTQGGFKPADWACASR